MGTVDRDVAVSIPHDGVRLEGLVVVPHGPRGLVVFAAGDGSGRFGAAHRTVARELQAHGFATLLLDLLTHAEEQVDYVTGHLRFNVDLLAERLMVATRWVQRQEWASELGVAFFGSGTGAAAALVAAADMDDIAAVVARAGRPELAHDALARVDAAVLLLVGSLDDKLIPLNEQAKEGLTARTRCELRVIRGAGRAFEEPGAISTVAALATDWIGRYVAHDRPGQGLLSHYAL